MDNRATPFLLTHQSHFRSIIRRQKATLSRDESNRSCEQSVTEFGCYGWLMRERVRKRNAVFEEAGRGRTRNRSWQVEGGRYCRQQLHELTAAGSARDAFRLLWGRGCKPELAVRKNIRTDHSVVNGSHRKQGYLLSARCLPLRNPSKAPIRDGHSGRKKTPKRGSFFIRLRDQRRSIPSHHSLKLFRGVRAFSIHQPHRLLLRA